MELEDESNKNNTKDYIEEKVEKMNRRIFDHETALGGVGYIDPYGSVGTREGMLSDLRESLKTLNVVRDNILEEPNWEGGITVPLPVVSHRVGEFIDNSKGIPLEDLLIASMIRHQQEGKSNPYEEEDEFVLECFNELHIALEYGYRLSNEERKN